MRSVEQLAAEHRLSPSRMPAVFLILRRNTRSWTQESFPRAGERRSWSDDPGVFQYIPGHGMQLHPLATWGAVNWQLGRCLATRRRRLRQAQPAAAARRARAASRPARALPGLGVLLRLRAGDAAVDQRHGAGDGDPGALTRGRGARRAALRAACAACAGSVRDAPARRRIRARRDRQALRHVLVRAGLQILNGELQAINGLRDAAVLGHSRRAARLVARGDRAARAALGGFDTGAWSLYSAAGGESTLPYHQLTTGILGELCRRTEQCRLLPRRAPLRALRDRAAADRDRAAARAPRAPQHAAALHALEGLRGAGARVRAARAAARARHAARPRRPRRALDAAGARPLPGARLGARARGPAGQDGADGPRAAAEAEAEAADRRGGRAADRRAPGRHAEPGGAG